MAGQGSARVTLKEIDLSQVRDPQILPQGVPAAVVGTARKGPAFVPRTFANIQQFEEVFGSMSTRGREANSNRIGPLALNEWLKSANAGTYLRVLGVGDGKAADSSGKVESAGFVVGEELVQKASGAGLSKVGKNQHATIEDADRDAAKALGKTHFLGCFMKDASGSNYLKESGIQVVNSAGSIIITATDIPQANNTIKIQVTEEDSGASDERTLTFTANGGGADGNGQVALDAGSVKAVFDDFKKELLLLADSDGANANEDGTTGTLADHITVSVTQGSTETDESAIVVITSKHDSLLSKTNDSIVKFNLTPTDPTSIKVGDKTASVASQNISFGGGGTESAFADIVFSGNPDHNNIIIITALSYDGDFTFTNQPVTYVFKSDLTNNTDASKLSKGNVVADVYDVINNEEVHVKIVEGNFQGTVSNLKAAFKRVAAKVGTGANVDVNPADTAGSGTKTKHEDHLTVTDINESSFRIVQVLKGTAGRAKSNGNVAIQNNCTDVVIKGTINVADNAAEKDIARGASTGFFKGGADGFAELTIQLVGQPNNEDNIELHVISEAGNAEAVQTFRFYTHAGAAAATGDDNVAGVVNGERDNAAGTAVIIGATFDETLSNLKNAIIYGALSNIRDVLEEGADKSYSSSLILNDSENSLTIVANDADTQKGAKANLNTTVAKVSDGFIFTNPDGQRIVGNFGEKSENFVGGGGGASPVIRGVLMTPQGVRPALSVAEALEADFVVDSDSPNLSLTAVRKDFGGTVNSDLAGYVIGEVSSNSQGFTLLLNGFSNSEASAKISCSFDPDSSSYFAKVLNTDPTKIEELGHYLYAWWDIDKEVAVPSNSGLLHQGAAVDGSNYSSMLGFLLDGAGGEDKPNYQSFESRYQAAKTPWIVSQKFGSDSYKLFRLHSLDDGEIGGTQYRLLISDLRYVNDATYGSFTLSLERLGTNPVEGDVIASWKRLTLDPDSRNYIARVIGDQYLYYDFDRDDEKQRLQSKGNFDLRNNYVRIELSDDLLSGNVPVDALPTGFLGHAKLQTAVSENFVEPGGEGGAKVFTASDDSALTILSEAQVAPMKFVRSLSREVIETSLEASDDLAWGVKFAKKENADSKLKELSEIEYDPSIASYAKFFPSFGDKATQVMIEDDGTDSDFENDRFSLENIKIDSFDTENNRITDWAGAEYQRGGVSSDDIAVQISRDAKSTNVKYLKFRCMFQGGFDGVNIFDAEKADLSGVASLREANDEKESKVYTGPTVVAYQKACDVLADKSAVELQVLALPGQRASAVTNYAMTACEERFDALYVMDIEEKDASNELIESDDYKPHVANTITHFEGRVLDSSFGAAYFPDLAVRRTSDNSAKVVPPSVGVLGVISRNDRIKAPWFAPAGLNRGRVNSPGVKLQMNRDLLNDLYDADVNPIYEPAGRGGEVYVFGQKTLLQGESALDRINVRRLLIDIRRKVKAIGESLLFEPNRESTLTKFSALVEPIMQDVQKRQGVARYKVQIDSSTTTQNDIENNTVRGKIYLQPLKSIEFISLDFVVTNTIE